MATYYRGGNEGKREGHPSNATTGGETGGPMQTMVDGGSPYGDNSIKEVGEERLQSQAVVTSFATSDGDARPWSSVSNAKYLEQGGRCQVGYYDLREYKIPTTERENSDKSRSSSRSSGCEVAGEAAKLLLAQASKLVGIDMVKVWFDQRRQGGKCPCA